MKLKNKIKLFYAAASALQAVSVVSGIGDFYLLFRFFFVDKVNVFEPTGELWRLLPIMLLTLAAVGGGLLADCAEFTAWDLQRRERVQASIRRLAQEARRDA